MFTYIDETGNAGMFDFNQPLFITAALITKTNFDLLHEKEIKTIALSINKNELHGNEFGVDGVERIAEELLKLFKKCDARFCISFVDKKYLTTTKFVATLFDPSENRAVPPHIYNLRHCRLLLTYHIHKILSNSFREKFWASITNTKKSEAYKMLLDSLCDLEKDIICLSDEGLKKRINDAIQWVKKHPESINIDTNKKSINRHLPNMVAFSNLMEDIEKRSKLWNREVIEIIHHEQSQFEVLLKDYHEIFSKYPAENIQFWGQKYNLQYTKGSHFRVVKSKDSAGIQAIDVVLWLLNRYKNGKNIEYNSSNLLNYVIKKSYISDFSFESIKNELNEQWSRNMKLNPPNQKKLKKVKEFFDIEKEYTKQEMLEYEKAQ